MLKISVNFWPNCVEDPANNIFLNDIITQSRTKAVGIGTSADIFTWKRRRSDSNFNFKEAKCWRPRKVKDFRIIDLGSVKVLEDLNLF